MRSSSHPIPLRYVVSDWRQCTRCLSNTSSNLHIRVSEFINNCDLRGLRVSVEHDTLGVLFATVLHASGCIVQGCGCCGDDYSEYVPEDITEDQILSELKKYGFIIEFSRRKNLIPEQLDYLATLSRLGFDKIRMLSVRSRITTKSESHINYKTYLVAFNVRNNPNWLSNVYVEDEDRFQLSLKSGSAAVCNSDPEKNFSWDWLDYVANISDILRDNTR